MDSKRLCAVPAAAGLTFNDQVCAWSRVDFLRSIKDGKPFAKFVRAMKAPMPHEPRKRPTFATILAAQEAALKDNFGLSWDEFDAQWSAYVRKNYPRR